MWKYESGVLKSQTCPNSYCVQIRRYQTFTQVCSETEESSTVVGEERKLLTLDRTPFGHCVNFNCL
jgi:hypothetical protein